MHGRFDFSLAAFWGRGFRPFFFLGSLYAAASGFFWAFFLDGKEVFENTWQDPVLWHGHEMVYGFSVSIIAGFLLTAVANWTGAAPLRGKTLLFLCLLWVLGRVLLFLPQAPDTLRALADLLFLPFLALGLAFPLMRSRAWRNLIFLVFLTVLFFLNAAFHFGWIEARVALDASVLAVMMVVSLVGSRVIPSFTVAGLRLRGILVYQTDHHKIDTAALCLLAVLAFLTAADELGSFFSGAVAVTASFLHLWRMRSWHTLKTGSDPLLWILHAGHLWLVAGLCALGFYGLGFLQSPSPGLHMLTVGAIGSLTIGMMARVALGHTGRPLVVRPAIAFSFVLMQISAVLRVLAFAMPAGEYFLWAAAAAVFWSLAFALYFIFYTPILLGPRPDGLDP